MGYKLDLRGIWRGWAFYEARYDLGGISSANNNIDDLFAIPTM